MSLDEIKFIIIIILVCPSNKKLLTAVMVFGGEDLPIGAFPHHFDEFEAGVGVRQRVKVEVLTEPRVRHGGGVGVICGGGDQLALIEWK